MRKLPLLMLALRGDGGAAVSAISTVFKTQTFHRQLVKKQPPAVAYEARL